MLYVTHDMELAARAHRIVTIRDGVVAAMRRPPCPPLARKSVTDLTRRKARAFFTVLTLALAVASVGIFAVPSLMQQAMEREVAANERRRDRLVRAAGAQRGAARTRSRALPNVAAVEPRSMFVTRVLGRRAASRRRSIVGVPDYARQRVDIVAVDSGVAAGWRQPS